MPVYSYKTKAGETLYRVTYRKPDHSQGQKRGFTRKRDAELYLSTIEVSKARGEYIDTQESKATVGELGTIWLNSQTHLKASSFHSLEVGYRLHVLPRWENTKIGDIRHSHVQAWVSELSTRKSASTVIRAYGALASILDVAVRDRRLLDNPARGTKLPKKTKKPHAYLTHNQVEALAEASGKQSTLIYLLAYTGLRWGEATALRLNNLDLLKKRLTVSENAVSVGGTIHLGTPKSHEARNVPLPEFIIPLLAQECEGKSRTSLVFGDGYNHLKQPSHGDGWLEVAVRKCQEVDADFPRVTAHDLRHTAASLSVSAGANVKAIQRMLGHAQASMTLDTYADLFDTDLDNVSEALNRAKLAQNDAKMMPRAIFS